MSFFQKAGGAGWDGLAVMVREIAISAMPKTHFTAPMDGHEQTASHGQSWKCQEKLSGVFCEVSYFSAEIGNETQLIWSWNGLKHVKTTNHIGLQMISIDLPSIFDMIPFKTLVEWDRGAGPFNDRCIPCGSHCVDPQTDTMTGRVNFAQFPWEFSVPSGVIKHGLPDNPPCISFFSGFFDFPIQISVYGGFLIAVD